MEYMPAALRVLPAPARPRERHHKGEIRALKFFVRTKNSGKDNLDRPC